MSNVTILYQGGSGGFALYYYLLLSGKYQYDIDTVQSMIAQQFPRGLSADPSKWKNNEFRPDNVSLKKTTGPRLFLICNPLFSPDMYNINQWISDNTYKILLYTDIHLQLRMAWEKRAYWFTEVSRQHFNAPPSDRQYFRYIINSSEQYNKSWVDPTLLEVIKEFWPNQMVRLEDFINSKTVANFPEPNQFQLDFLTYWTALQTVKSLHLLRMH
jgi:hypothetical protein